MTGTRGSHICLSIWMYVLTFLKLTLLLDVIYVSPVESFRLSIIEAKAHSWVGWVLSSTLAVDRLRLLECAVQLSFSLNPLLISNDKADTSHTAMSKPMDAIGD